MKRNKRNIIKGIKSGLSLFLVAGMVACSGENTTGVEANEVADEGVAETETMTADTWDQNRFNSTFASNNYYEDWDRNDDNLLDQNEYNTGIYSTWDTNNDNSLDQNEWTTASNDFGLENENWGTWDSSGDGTLDEKEFTAGMGNNTWFSDYDANDDNMLDEREYTDGLFGQWDNNANGMLEENEYGYYNTYFGS